MNILSYLDNKQSGFGKQNDDELYKEELEADKDNFLFDKGVYGSELLEKLL